MAVDLNKILVTGGNGTVASYIDFGIKTTRADFDMTNFARTLAFVEKTKPEVILHLAAETDLAKCEADPVHAYMVNAIGTYNIAMAAKIVRAKIVYVSTDAVFSQSDKPHDMDDEPSPESIYGHSKYLGELAVKGISDNYIIVRTSWVFGGGKEKDKKFVAKFIAQLNNTEANAVNDQCSSPTYARDFIGALKNLILEEKMGTFHIVNSGVASRYDMALVIAESLKKDTKIIPVSADFYKVPAYQRSSGGLTSGLGLRSWQEALTDYIHTEWAA